MSSLDLFAASHALFISVHSYDVCPHDVQLWDFPNEVFVERKEIVSAFLLTKGVSPLDGESFAGLSGAARVSLSQDHP